MERAAKLITNNKYARRVVAEEDVIRSLWPVAVGKTIAKHTARVSLVRTNVVVEVEDATWQKQLFALSSQILARIRKLTGSDAVQGIEFRVAIPKRQPQRAESRRPDAPLIPVRPEDEAERIQDPVLKKVYRLSRKRATA
ncbi:MAG: DUF721 domain-containing protein [Acidobacteriaceae bacterium]|nr:DUF721 domain-containing protein [Acidobacteriaceae bacterium]